MSFGGNKDVIQTCPFNSSHRFAGNKYVYHVSKCALKNNRSIFDGCPMPLPPNSMQHLTKEEKRRIELEKVQEFKDQLAEEEKSLKEKLLAEHKIEQEKEAIEIVRREAERMKVNAERIYLQNKIREQERKEYEEYMNPSIHFVDQLVRPENTPTNVFKCAPSQAPNAQDGDAPFNVPIISRRPASVQSECPPNPRSIDSNINPVRCNRVPKVSVAPEQIAQLPGGTSFKLN